MEQKIEDLKNIVMFGMTNLQLLFVVSEQHKMGLLTDDEYKERLTYIANVLTQFIEEGTE